MSTIPLSSLTSNLIVTHLKSLVQKEKALTLEIIDYLSEVSRRRLYLPKHTSLFSFMMEELGYCPSLAQLRLNSIKALQIVPEAREKVLNNKVSLNSLAKAQGSINKENKDLKNQSAAPLSTAEQRELFSAIEDVPAKKIEEALQSKRHEIEVRNAEALKLPPPPVKPAKIKILLEADSELIQFIDEVKSLLSHSNPDGDLATNLKKALPLAIRELKIAKGLIKRAENKKREEEKQQPSPRKSEKRTSSMKYNSPNEMPSRKRIQITTRAIPVAIRRLVWQRDQGCCQFRDPMTKKLCGSRHQVQYDHLKPWSFGGDHSAENIFLTCAQHNRFRWQSLMQS